MRWQIRANTTMADEDNPGYALNFSTKGTLILYFKSTRAIYFSSNADVGGNYVQVKGLVFQGLRHPSGLGCLKPVTSTKFLPSWAKVGVSLIGTSITYDVRKASVVCRPLNSWRSRRQAPVGTVLCFSGALPTHQERNEEHLGLN